MKGLLLILFFAASTFTVHAQDFSKAVQQAFLITRMVEKFHIQPKPLNDIFSQYLFQQFIKAADEDQVIFHASDIATLSAFTNTLDEEILQRKTNFLQTASAIMRKRVRDIAEQSFNEMQAYLLLQEKTSEKLAEANAKRRLATKEFAARNNVNLVEGTASEFVEKMNKATDVVEYRNVIYLLFFKCNWQWNELSKAIKTNKVNDIEQARNALITYAKEGLTVLDTMKNFSGDPSLANACKYSLNQFKRMSENDIPKMTDFILKNENFEKVKKSFDSKPQKDKTQQDIDAYNKAVNEVNAAVNTFNSTGKFIADTQSNIINTYNKADKDFADRHTPYFKK